MENNVLWRAYFESGQLIVLKYVPKKDLKYDVTMYCLLPSGTLIEQSHFKNKRLPMHIEYCSTIECALDSAIQKQENLLKEKELLRDGLSYEIQMLPDELLNAATLFLELSEVTLDITNLKYNLNYFSKAKENLKKKVKQNG